MIFYFSGTGNSRYCAKRLAHRLGDEAVDAFPFLRDGRFPALTSRSPWVFVSPTYGWQLPRIFEALLRGGRFSGSRDAYFVMTCGAEIGDPIPRLEALCRDMGLTYRGVLPVVMPENYIALFRAPGPEEARAIVEAAVPGLEEGAERIRRGESLPPVRRGAIDKLKSGPVNAFFYRFVIKAGPFRSTSACVGCGKCAAVCVENNIRLRDGRPVWGDRCTHCMACICGCPAEPLSTAGPARASPATSVRNTGRSEGPWNLSSASWKSISLRATWRPFSRPCGRWTRAISAGTTAVSPTALSSAPGAPWRAPPLIWAGWVRYAMRRSSRWRSPAGQTAWRRPWRPLSGPTPMRSPSSTSSPFTAPDYEAEPVSPFWPNSASTGNPAGALSSYVGPSPRTRATNRATSAPGRS